MKIVLISDTHGRHDQVKIPECDILIHAGDLTARGTEHQTSEAVSWLMKQPAEYILFIAGNHDFWFENHDFKSDKNYLENSGREIKGIKFWGSPYTPKFFDWAFMYPRGHGVQWNNIPRDTQVLITHGPPMGILDTATPGGQHLGCYDLKHAVDRNLPNLKVHAFGHIHGSYGHKKVGDVDFYNCAQVDEQYEVLNQPWEIEL